MEEKRTKNAAIDLRVSTARQARTGGEIEGYSIPAQPVAGKPVTWEPQVAHRSVGGKGIRNSRFRCSSTASGVFRWSKPPLKSPLRLR